MSKQQVLKMKVANKSSKKLQLFTGIMIGIILSMSLVQRASAISSTGWTVNGQNTIFDGTGKVGIGTTTPSDKLTITGTGWHGLTIENTGNTSNDFSMMRYLVGGVERGVFYADNSSMNISASSGSILRLNSFGGEVRMPHGSGALQPYETVFNWQGSAAGMTTGANYIRGTTIISPEGGLVGIGSSAPLEMLEVGESGNLSLKAKSSTLSPGGIKFKDENNQLKGEVIYDKASNQMRIRNTSNGDICLGAC
jgi:hypothetical protein